MKNKKIFEEHYWNKNYAEPKTMDGIGNAREHANYLKGYLDVEKVDISKIADLGAGYGFLLKEMIRAFKPFEALALEPSMYAFKKLKRKKFTNIKSTQIYLKNQDLHSYCKEINRTHQVFDLAICTSVFQYISSKDLIFILSVLKKHFKYLYLTIPTDQELHRQKTELNFEDSYALKRSKEEYQQIISPHFTFLSSRFVESKYFFNNKTTLLTDLLFRF